jgi:hypothetical protein
MSAMPTSAPRITQARLQSHGFRLILFVNELLPLVTKGVASVDKGAVVMVFLVVRAPMWCETKMKMQKVE